VLTDDAGVEELLEPVELRRVVEHNAGDHLSVRPVAADHLRSKALDELSPHLGIFTQQPMHDLVARLGCGAVTSERFERRALARADPAGDGDREWSSARRQQTRRKRLRRPQPDQPALR